MSLTLRRKLKSTSIDQDTTTEDDGNPFTLSEDLRRREIELNTARPLTMNMPLSSREAAFNFDGMVGRLHVESIEVTPAQLLEHEILGAPVQRVMTRRAEVTVRGSLVYAHEAPDSVVAHVELPARGAYRTDKRYILHPGRVRARDGQIHQVTGRQLCQLYGLPQLANNVVLVSCEFEEAFTSQAGDIHLYPCADGNYFLPGS